MDSESLQVTALDTHQGHSGDRRSRHKDRRTATPQAHDRRREDAHPASLNTAVSLFFVVGREKAVPSPFLRQAAGIITLLKNLVVIEELTFTYLFLSPLQTQ